MKGSSSAGVPAVVEASAGVPEVDGGDNVNCCLCSLDSMEVLDSVIGVGVLLERVPSQLPYSSGSLAFVLTPGGRGVEEPWSEFDASLVFVHDEEKQNSQKVKEIRFRKLRPNTGWWHLMWPRCLGKIGRSKTKNNQTLYAEGCKFSLENCPNCKYKDFRSTEGIWEIALEAVKKLRKIEKRSLWHFEFLCTKDDIEWLNKAHPTAVPETCIPWQKKCAKNEKMALENKKMNVNLDNLELADLWEVKAKLCPITRIWWKAVSQKYVFWTWNIFLVVLYFVFTSIALFGFADLLIRYNIINIIESDSISKVWRFILTVSLAILYSSVLILPFLRLERWSKKAKKIFSRHKFMQDSRARKVRKDISN